MILQLFLLPICPSMPPGDFHGICSMGPCSRYEAALVTASSAGHMSFGMSFRVPLNMLTTQPALAHEFPRPPNKQARQVWMRLFTTSRLDACEQP